MADKKKSPVKGTKATPASKLRDLDVLDSRIQKVKGGAMRKRGRKRTDP